MSLNQALFAWSSDHYTSFLNDIQSADSFETSYSDVRKHMELCFDGKVHAVHLELGGTAHALHWIINEIIPPSVVGHAVFGQPLKISGDTDISGGVHNRQVKINNHVLSQIAEQDVTALCETLPDNVHNAEAYRTDSKYITGMYKQLTQFYSEAAANDHAVISCAV